MYSFNANKNIDRIEVGCTFTCKFASGFNNAIFRGTAENANLSMNIQKIIITKVLVFNFTQNFVVTVFDICGKGG